MLASLAAAAVIALCPATTPVAAVPDPDAPAPEALVACVGAAPITGELFSHWFAISRKGSGPGVPASRLRGQVIDFLANGRWLEGEATERGITVSDRAVRHQLTAQKHQSLPSEQAFKKFLEASGMTRSDLKYRVRLDLLSERLRKAFSGTGSPAVRQRRLSRFVVRFRAKWKARTACLPDYRTDSCGAALTAAGP